MTVIEARDRVGGRVYSRRLPNGAVIEMGADFFEADHYVLRGYAKRFGLTIVPRGMRYSEREPRGVDTTPDAVAAVAELARGMLLRPSGGEPLSVAALLDSLDVDPAAPARRCGRASRCRRRTAPTASTPRVLGHFGSSYGGPESDRIVEGNDAHRTRPGREPRRASAPVDAGRVDRLGCSTAVRVHDRPRRVRSPTTASSRCPPRS